MIKPVFLPNYRSWEHSIGQHDELTDIFSLGLLLASMACGLDFTDAAELEVFAANRANLFELNRRLNPVVASAIVQMTELYRRKRAPRPGPVDLPARELSRSTAALDFNHLQGFKESGLSGKRRLIQARLRDRLFDISRRDRLIYFKTTLQTLNLTVASVPIC